MNRSFRLLLVLLSFYGCTGRSKGTADGTAAGITAAPEIPVLNYSVQHVYAHDTLSYTEGFLYHDHHFFESSGSPDEFPRTRSIVGIADFQSGKLDKKIELDKNKYFGEGIAFFKDRLYQLTYKNHKGFIYDAKTFKLLDTFAYRNAEGWALTTDSNSLIMSDGTSRLTYLDPVSLKPVKTLAVTLSGAPLDSLNELEYIHGYIYANRFTQDYVVKIDPASGKVVGKLDLSSLVEQEKNRDGAVDVLNGIAYDPDSDKIYVTGKLWAGVYEIAFSH